MNRQQQIDEFLLRMHVLAVARLKAQPHRLVEAQAQLARWRERSGATRSDPYWNSWDALLSGPLEALESRVCGRSDAAAALRNVSPLSCLVSQRERSELLQGVRPS